MPSSGETLSPFDIPLPQPRPLRELKRSPDPRGDLWQLMRAQAQSRRALADQSQKGKERVLEILIFLAGEVCQSRSFLDSITSVMQQAGLSDKWRSLDIGLKRLEDHLRQEKITYYDPLGEELKGNLENIVDVQSYIRRPTARVTRVIETVAPIVYYKGELVKPGVVIVETPGESEEGKK